jgi:Ca2+-binding EF-hand superfamily protein
MRYTAIAIFGFAVMLAGCAGGGDEHRKPREAPWHPASAMLTKYITNADGSLTRAQMDAGLRRDFNAADVKHAGCLDEDETRAINEQRYAADQSTYSPLVDFKGRGCIDFDEFAATPLSLFDTMDRDNNGVLTAKELNPYADKKPGEGDDDSEHHGHDGRHGGGDPNGPGGN